MAKGNSSFAELLNMQSELKAQAAERERLKAIEAKKKAEAERLANEFHSEMDKLGVQKKDLSKGRQIHAAPKPAPIPRQRMLDEKAVLEDSLSDEIGIEHLLCSGDLLAYHHPSVAPDIPRKLYQGKWAVKGTLDLHGFTIDEARITLIAFLNAERKAGHRVVRIIHGKGFGSVARISVLKNKVPVWLVQREEVLAFIQAPEHDGGSGALLALLAPAKSNAQMMQGI